jgi:outer membrane protein assembly factor BamB
LDDAVALPDGGLLLAHVDPADARLIALDAEGTVRWQRSYVPAIRSQSVAQAKPRLVTTGSRVYLLLQNTLSTSSIADIFSVGLDDGALVRIFTGGTRNLAHADAWALAVDGGLVLVNYGDSNVVALNVRSALKAVQPIDRRE